MTVHNQISSSQPMQAFSKVSRLLSQRKVALVQADHFWSQDLLQAKPIKAGQLTSPLQLFRASPSPQPSPLPVLYAHALLQDLPKTDPEQETSHSNESATKIRDTGLKDNHGRAIRLTAEAHQGLNKIKEIASSKGIRVSINSSYRSVERQAQLFNQALKKYGSVSRARKWVAPPGKSRHNYGNAIDLNLLRKGKKIPQHEFDAIITQAGMYRPMSWETWHVEPLSTKSSRSKV